MFKRIFLQALVAEELNLAEATDYEAIEDTATHSGAEHVCEESEWLYPQGCCTS